MIRRNIDIKKESLLLLFFIYESDFYGCNLINSTLQGHSKYIVSLLIIFYIIFKWRQLTIVPKDLGNSFWILTFFPLISSFNSLIFQEQPLHLSLLGWLKHNAYFLFLFVLILNKIRTNEILTAIRNFAIIYSFLSFLQVLNPSFQHLFAAYYEDGSLFMRNNIIRIVMPGISYVLFAYIESLYNFFKNGKINHFLLFIFFLVTIYLKQTRQLLFASAVISIIITIYFYLHSKQKIQILAFIIIICTIILSNFEHLFGSFIRQTKDELTNTSYNRWLAYNYFSNEIFSNISTFLFGMGKAAMNTQYAEKIQDLWIHKGISRNDVGIIGEWYTYGIFYILAYLRLCYYIVKKYSNRIYPLAKYFTICTFCHCLFIFPLDDTVLWSCIIYISLKSIITYDYCLNSYNNPLRKSAIFSSK